MVFQKPNPFPAMTICENVLSGLKLSGMKTSRSRRRSSSSASRRPGCGTRSRTGSDRPGGALSGGQQQRLCIARSLAVEPAGAADGRAVLGPGPDVHPPDRGDDGRDCARLRDDRDRHPQHAAGPAGVATSARSSTWTRASPGGSSRSARPRRSSTTPTTRGPPTTSTGGSDEPRRTARLAASRRRWPLRRDRRLARCAGAHGRRAHRRRRGLHVERRWRSTQWRSDVARLGLSINYQGGRLHRRDASSTSTTRSTSPSRRSRSCPTRRRCRRSACRTYLPIVAGGTSMMYNLQNAIGGRSATCRCPRHDREGLHGQDHEVERPARSRADNPGLTLAVDSRSCP